jgi:hypothetical protein
MSLKRARETGRKVNEGAWITVNEEAFPELAGMSLHVRGLNNRDFNRLQAKLTASGKRLSNGRDGAEHVLTSAWSRPSFSIGRASKRPTTARISRSRKEKFRELLEDDDVRIVLRPAIVNAATEVRAEEQNATEAAAKN